MGSLLRRATKPKLIPIDPGYGVIEFQFTPQSLRENIGARYGSASTGTRQTPISQFIAGQLNQISFQALLFAERDIDEVANTLNQLIESTKYDDSLGRPPIWNFVWGDWFNETVVVESIGDVRYGEPRESILGYGANLRSVTFRIVLRSYREFDIELTDPSKPEENTFFHRVRSKDTWESIAAQFYKKALLGDLLRRENPDKPFLTAGEVVIVLKPEKVRGVRVTPVGIPLRRTTKGLEAQRQAFVARGRDFESHIL